MDDALTTYRGNPVSRRALALLNVQGAQRLPGLPLVQDLPVLPQPRGQVRGVAEGSGEAHGQGPAAAQARPAAERAAYQAAGSAEAEIA